MSKKGYYLDTSNFKRKLDKICGKTIPDRAVKGLGRASQQLILDAIEKRPQVPFLKGHLRGSGEIDSPEKIRDGFQVTAGFTKEYAAKLHEMSPQKARKVNWTRTGAKYPGPKFLSSKLTMYGKDYFRIIADTIREGR